MSTATTTASPDRASEGALKVAPGCKTQIGSPCNLTVLAPPPLFTGVARWPHVDDIFAVRSLSILADGGISAWFGSGGCRGYDGRLGFGPVSSPALEIMQDFSATHPGFRWTDAAGATWAVRFADRFKPGRQGLAYAASYGGSAWVLDPDVRQAVMTVLDAQVVACDRPARQWDDADRARFARLAQALYRLRLVEGASRLLLCLRRRFEEGQERDVLLNLEEIEAATRWGALMTSLDQPANDPVAVLHATMGLEIARVRLGDLGWDPRIESRSAAVAHVDQCGQDVYRVHVAPLLVEAANHFGQPFELSPTMRR